MKVLIVEDEPRIAEILSDYMTQAGFTVSCLATGEQVVSTVKADAPDLILLDIMLPGKDGLEICREVRKFSELPIILVSARADELDRLLGLELGADDYICKPFSPREVVARVKAVLRRVKLGGASEPEDAKLLCVDEEKGRILVKGTPVELTRTEFKLLSMLLQKPGKVYSRSQLLDSCCNEFDVFDRVIDSHIKNLRKKLAKLLPGQEIIHSVYGVGYRFELSEASQSDL